MTCCKMHAENVYIHVVIFVTNDGCVALQTVPSIRSVNTSCCEPVREKTNNLGFDQVQHKPDCTVTETG